MQGKAVKLKCESTDNPPPANYKITKVGSADQIKDFDCGITYVMEAHMLTHAMSSAEEGGYKCITQDATGTHSEESEVLRLVLKSKFSCVCLFNNCFPYN